MATRMLIDARHPEETRVAVLNGNRIEEFDFESAERKQIKGNIFLAKVTRVEPSLQAAFVDFGGNRHGFLAFSEIHPDYYQIPSEDRAALLAEEQEHADEEAALRAAEDDEGDGEFDADDGGSDDEDHEDGIEEIDTSEKDEVATIEDGRVEDDDSDDEGGRADDEEVDGRNGDNRQSRGRRSRGRRQERSGGGNRSRAKEMDDLRAKRQALRRRYKIQDVIQRRQVLLVQVVKEERGNKGAALTSYLSLAGRYCVLMPNSSHGGGISRKISSGSDRNRLKQIVAELSLPKSMGLIVRTAGLQRTKTEIKRDFDYLARLWDEIRERTLASSAPALIHSDSDLIKRAIRDIYNRDIEEVIVEGEEGFRAAKQFMKLLMPSHARRVKAYSDPVPLFQRFGAEDQLTAMYDPVVQLKSGGYLVINPTEALVSIDINSGRSTKEHGIEQTALSTNMEAAKEIARQLRLRDMAGLVVIDFIDMEHSSNVRKVERAMKDALKNDRARIQIGRISSFGLMEMSRQRLRTGVLEATTRSCPHCDGTGLVRTASSAGLSALRLIEDEAAKGKGTQIALFASTEAAVYLLNAKRADLAEIENRYGVSVQVVPEGEQEGAKMRVQSGGPPPAQPPKFSPIVDEDDGDEDIEEEELEDEEEEKPAGDRQRQAPAGRSQREEEDEGERKKRRRRRRGGRGRNRSDEQEGEDTRADGDEDTRADRADDDRTDGNQEATAEEAADESTGASAEEGERQRSRRRRGGRRRKPADAASEEITVGSEEADAGPSEQPAEEVASEAAASEPAATSPETPAAEEEVKKPKTRRVRKPKATSEAAVAGDGAKAASSQAVEEAAPSEEKPKRRRTRRKKDEEATAEPEEVAPQAASPEAPAPEPASVSVEHEAAEAQPATSPGGADAAVEEQGEGSAARRGWWQRTFGT